MDQPAPTPGRRSVTAALRELLDARERRGIETYGKATVQRFWARVEVGEAEKCWPWLGRWKVTGGYGRLTVRGRRVLAHRFAFELTKSDPSPSLDVCHSCDNPSCCNPDHLWIGTAFDNMRDMVHKGRARMGERSPSARLTDTVVRQMRAEYRRGVRGRGVVSLAQAFQVNSHTVWCIVNHRTWRHVQ